LFVGVGNRTGETGLKYSVSGSDLRQKFTGYQKDSETSLDFAEARMYENRFGRFTAVDPKIASGKSANPQTFNRYVYCLNNPATCVDPAGLDGFWAYANYSDNTRSYRHFNSEDELKQFNKVNDTPFCKNNPNCATFKHWNGGEWIIWGDRM